MRTPRHLTASALLLLAACHSASRPAVGPAPGAASPAEVRRAWQDAFNRADTAALVALYAEDAVLVPPSGTVLTGGRTAARATIGRLMEDRTLTLRGGHQRVTPGGAGHLQGTWLARARAGAGVVGSGTYFMVFERGADGRWNIVYHVWRDDRDPDVSRETPPCTADVRGRDWLDRRSGLTDSLSQRSRRSQRHGRTAMLLIRDVFRCRPGKAGEVARRLQATLASTEVEDGFRNGRVLVDYVGAYWTVVMEGEVDDLSRFDHHMAGYASRPAVQEAMRGYTDLVESGYREVFRILPPPEPA